MPLESCMILLDNSEYMRNGDYVPSRLGAQSDAANLVANQKTQSNPESTVGVIAMSSKGPSTGAQLLVSPTDDLGKILSALHGVPLCGELTPPGTDAVDVAASVQVAALALKHRRNKNGAQRIVLFVGSPLEHATSRSLVKAGKQLKKNNVFIDVVCLGELEENEAKLRELVDAANGPSAEGVERTCHLVTIPAGVLPSDVLVSSPVLRADGAGGGMGGGAAAAGAPPPGGAGDGFAEFGGIDPNMDPELAMALRVSMEEERARQERAAAAASAEGGEGGASGDGPAEGGGEGVEVPAAAAAAADDDEDALLQQALAMSMAEGAGGGDADAAPMETEGGGDGGGGEDDDEMDAEMQAALAMSMADDGGPASGEGGSGPPSGEAARFQDPQFVNQLLGSLPGVDPNDPAIRAALEGSGGGEGEEGKDSEEKEDGKKDE